MCKSDIYEKLTDIFQDVLDQDDIALSAGMTADDVEEWDSLTHVRLIVTIEQKFGVSFTNAEVENFKRVGDLVDAIKKRTS